MKKLATRKFLIEYEKSEKNTIPSGENQYFRSEVLKECKVYYHNNKEAFDTMFDEIIITTDNIYIIGRNKAKSVIVIFSDNEDIVVKLESAIDIKTRKNYFIVEEKENKIRVIDKKGNDIFYFMGSFYKKRGIDETILICKANWFLTKKEKFGYVLYDCLNKKTIDISVNKIRPLVENMFGIYDENDNKVKIIFKNFAGVYEIKLKKGEKFSRTEIFKELIPSEYKKINACNEYICAQKENGDKVFYNYDGNVLKNVEM